jgi:hypothetical protein
MTIPKYTKIFHSKALQNLPKFFLGGGLKINHLAALHLNALQNSDDEEALETKKRVVQTGLV